MAKATLPPREPGVVEPVPAAMRSASLTAGLRAARRAPWYRPAVAVYDWSFRRLHRLDQPAVRIEPVLRVQRCRLWRALRLADGTLLCRGATFGVLHLDNVRTREAPPASAVGREERPVAYGSPARTCWPGSG